MTAEARAERLRVLLWIAPWLPEKDEAIAAVPDRDDLDHLADAKDEDFRLANACLEIEWELEARAYVALERLTELIEGSPGACSERVKQLEKPELYDALDAVVELGWIDEAR